MEKVLFKEEQRFRQWWLWLIMVFALLAVIVPLMNAIAEEQTKLNSSNMSRLIIYGVVAVLFLTVIIVIMLFIRLKTKITSNGIYVAYIPFVRKWEKITKKDIKRYEVREYWVNREYGGYGMKKRRKAGRAFTISGNIGLQLYFNDGRKLLIGTQKQQAIRYAMIKLLGNEKKTPKTEKAKQEAKPLIGRKAKKILIVLALEIVLVIVIFSLIQIFK